MRDEIGRPEIIKREQSPTLTPYTCRRIITFSEPLFHGREHVESGSVQGVDRTIVYSNYLLGDMGGTNTTVLDSFGDSSLTLGPALYTTPVREEAEKYAYRRGRYTQAAVVKTSGNLRLYDFRRESDVTSNGHVPLDIAQRWQKYFEAHRSEIEEWIKEKGHKDHVINIYFRQPLDTYSRFLSGFIKRLAEGTISEPHPIDLSLGAALQRSDDYDYFTKRRTLDIRDMLGTLEMDPQWTGPNYGGLWARFVVEELGCDGIIAIEGGDGAEFAFAPTVALYNLANLTTEQAELLPSRA